MFEYDKKYYVAINPVMQGTNKTSTAINKIKSFCFSPLNLKSMLKFWTSNRKICLIFHNLMNFRIGKKRILYDFALVVKFDDIKLLFPEGLIDTDMLSLKINLKFFNYVWWIFLFIQKLLENNISKSAWELLNLYFISVVKT